MINEIINLIKINYLKKCRYHLDFEIKMENSSKLTYYLNVIIIPNT